MFLAETELITGGVSMYPTLETIRQLARTKEYRRIPLCRELYADRYTPVEVMRILRKASRHCYLLESASQTEVWGRYSFLGYEPSMEITCTDGTLKIRTTDAEGKTEETVRQVTHPGDTLREIIRKYKTPVMEKMPPFTGGLVGYFSYDYIKYSEPKLKLEDREQQDFRDMDLMLFDQVIVFDHFRQKVLLITGVMTEDLEASYEKAVKKLKEMAQLIRNGEHMEFEPLRLQSEIQPKFPKKKYAEMVEKAKHYIREGDIFQVVLSNPMRAKATGSLFDTYRVLRASNPSPYMFYFSSDDIELAGASPETLVKLENGTCQIEDHMFDHDALVFDNQITRAGIQLPDGTPYLELRCVGFPNFGIWSASQDAPFVCLEPWMGRCDDCGFTGDLSEKPFINHLKMDEMFETAYTIEIF